MAKAEKGHDKVYNYFLQFNGLAIVAKDES
jgi:hypothetical protein